MITDIILYILSLIMTLMFTISDTLTAGWTIWPPTALQGINYFFQQLMMFNFIFPMDTLMIVIIFILTFEVLYFSVKLLLKLFNWIRGAGGIEI
jgi:hypothetical protein